MSGGNTSLKFWATVAAYADREEAYALVTLLDAQGSTPAKIGARALVDSAGHITGTIGGGAVEGRAQRLALEAIQSGQAVVFRFDLQGAGPPVAEPICGGNGRVLIDPTASRHCAAYKLAAHAHTQRRRGVLLTEVRLSVHEKQDHGEHAKPATVSVQWLDESALDSHAGFPEPKALRRVLQREAPEFCVPDNPQADEPFEVLVDAIVPRPRLLIVGGGHVGQALALQARLVGFEIAVMDDREEFTRAELFPEGTTTACGETAAMLAAFPFTNDTYVALVTRGHQSDAEALTACLRKPHAYLGMIGSRRKVALVRQAFLGSGRASASEWDNLHSPIGLDIGALTVPEIATSIVAQLIAVRRKGVAPRMPT